MTRKGGTPIISLGDFTAARENLRTSLRELHVASRAMKRAEATAAIRRDAVRAELVRGTGTLLDRDKRIEAKLVPVEESTTDTVRIPELRALLEAAEVDLEPFTVTRHSLEPVDIDGKRLPKADALPIDGRLGLAGIANEARLWATTATFNEAERDKARLLLINTLRTLGKLPSISTVYVFDADSGAPGGVRVTVSTTLDVDKLTEQHPLLVEKATGPTTRAAHIRLDIRRLSSDEVTA